MIVEAPQQTQRRSYPIVQLQLGLLDDGFEPVKTSDFDESGHIWYWHVDGRLARLSRSEQAVTVALPEWFAERNAKPPHGVWRALQVLRQFAKRHGRGWRYKLGQVWMNGDYRRLGCSIDEGGALQSLRNDPSYGPGSGFIEKFR